MVIYDIQISGISSCIVVAFSEMGKTAVGTGCGEVEITSAALNLFLLDNPGRFSNCG